MKPQRIKDRLQKRTYLTHSSKKIKDPKVDVFLERQSWAKTPWLILPKSSVGLKGNISALNKALSKCIGTYVTYKDTFKGTKHENNNEEEFFRHMRKFDFYDSLQSLAKLNYILSTGYHRPRDPRELTFVRQLFSDIPRQRLENFWHMGRKLFSRQQLLSLIKVDIMKNNTKEQKKLVGDDPSSFGRLIFRVTDFTEIDSISKVKKCKTKKEKDDVWLGSFIRNITFNSSQQFRFILPRYWTIYFDCLERARKKLPKEAIDIMAEFEEATGGLDLKLFMFLGFGIFSHYFKIDETTLGRKPGEFLIGNQFFEKLIPAVRTKANRIFSAISSTKTEFIRAFNYEDRRTNTFYYGFQPIWRRPLFKLNENTYFLLDMRYLQEKMSFGIFGQINDYLLDKEKDLPESERENVGNKRNRLKGFIGRGFEIYVNDLFHRLYSRRRLTKVLYSQIDNDQTGGVDFIIYYPDTLLFIEVTTVGVAHNIILTADLKKIEKEIRQIFFGSEEKESKGKILQLDTAISLFLKGKLRKLKIAPKSIKNIYPILILEKGLPEIPPMRKKYREWFGKEGLLKGREDNFQCIDIEELEIMETLVNRGSTLPSIFEDWQKSAFKDWPLKNYLYEERKSDLSHNDYLREQIEGFRKCLEKVLFGKVQSGKTKI